MTRARMTDMSDIREQFLYGAPAAEANRTLHAHAHTATQVQWGERRSEPLTLIRTRGDNLIACATGLVGHGWLNLELLWVEPPFRSQGIGHELLGKIEAEAKRLGAHSAYLWTQEYEAPEFYRARGYAAFAELAEFGPGHQLIAMRKALA